MALVRKATVYDLLTVGWMLAVGAGFVVVISGNAEPYVAPRAVPEPIIAYWGGAAAVLVVGGLTAGRLAKKRAWRRMGRRANLNAGSSLLSCPDLTGTHRGRQVRVRTDSRTTSSGGRGGSNKKTMTVIEAGLDGPADRGLILAHEDRERSRRGPNLSVQHDEAVVVENVAGMGPSREMVERVLTPAVTSALAACTDHGLVLAGDAAGELRRQAELEDVDGLAGRLQSWMVGAAAGGLKDEPDVVSTELQHHLLDAVELERQLDAVVAVADAFEEATVASGGAA